MLEPSAQRYECYQHRRGLEEHLKLSLSLHQAPDHHSQAVRVGNASREDDQQVHAGALVSQGSQGREVELAPSQQLHDCRETEEDEGAQIESWKDDETKQWERDPYGEHDRESE